MWRGSLLPPGREAAPQKKACCAVQREQAPSPQVFVPWRLLRQRKPLAKDLLIFASHFVQMQPLIDV
jgi:hypothetical protein